MGDRKEEGWALDLKAWQSAQQKPLDPLRAPSLLSSIPFPPISSPWALYLELLGPPQGCMKTFQHTLGLIMIPMGLQAKHCNCHEPSSPAAQERGSLGSPAPKPSCWSMGLSYMALSR